MQTWKEHWPEYLFWFFYKIEDVKTATFLCIFLDTDTYNSQYWLIYCSMNRVEPVDHHEWGSLTLGLIVYVPSCRQKFQSTRWWLVTCRSHRIIFPLLRTYGCMYVSSELDPLQFLSIIDSRQCWGVAINWICNIISNHAKIRVVRLWHFVNPCNHFEL